VKLIPQNVEVKGFFAIVTNKRCYTAILINYNIIFVLHIFGVIPKNWILDINILNIWILGFEILDFGFYIE
jgi:hypothetical protein